MNARQSIPDALFREVHLLADGALDGTLSDEQCARLDRLVCTDAVARQLYVRYIFNSDSLRTWSRSVFSGMFARDPALALDDLDKDAICREISNQSSLFTGNLGVHALTTALHGTVGYFSSGWPVAYLVATVIFGIGAVIGSLTPMSQPEQVADNTRRPASSVVEPEMEFVGRITGMVDCQWVQSPESRIQSPSLDFRLSTLVSLGDRFTLSSGLMEITYNTGAKVILQGPVTYEVESAAGGFLSLGKLTARLEKKAEGGRWKAEEASNAKSPFPVPPSPFVVRTPTAVVTDLGTEFGVEVPKRGDTMVHVFEGKLDCRLVTNSGFVDTARRIIAGQTATITVDRVIVDRTTPPKVAFVRSIRHSSASTAQPHVAAYWRFEEDVPPATTTLKNSHVQNDVIRDWAKQRNPLTFYPGPADGWGNYIAGSDVPPPSMFRSGYSGGKKSFNSGALDAHKTGVLFHNTAMHGSGLNFPGSFCIEGFFKTAGDQSTAGMMAIVYKGPGTAAYLIRVNRQSPGAAQFALFDSAGSEASVSVSDRNYADGRWHYFAARFTPGTMIAGGTVSLLMGNEDGSIDRRSAATAPGFTVNTPSNNLFVGRKVHGHLSDPIEGHFRGLIDEVRICRDDVPDNQLVFPVGKEGH